VQESGAAAVVEGGVYGWRAGSRRCWRFVCLQELGTAASSVSYDASGLRSDGQVATSDYSQYQNDQATLPSYSTANPPSGSDVSSAAGGASSAVDSAVSSVNGYIDTANGEVTTAFQVADQTLKAQCGPDQVIGTFPQPEPHVS
jgi:hypothetical protein